MTAIQVYDGDGTRVRSPLAASDVPNLKAGDKLYSMGGSGYATVVAVKYSYRSHVHRSGSYLVSAIWPFGRRFNIGEKEYERYTLTPPANETDERMFGTPLTREAALKLKKGDVVYRRHQGSNPGYLKLPYTIEISGQLVSSVPQNKNYNRCVWTFRRKSGKTFRVFEEELFAYTTDEPGR